MVPGYQFYLSIENVHNCRNVMYEDDLECVADIDILTLNKKKRLHDGRRGGRSWEGEMRTEERCQGKRV